MNFLSIFVLIPLLMLAGLWAAQGIKAIRGVMVTGASALLIASVVLTFMYLGERSAGNTAGFRLRSPAKRQRNRPPCSRCVGKVLPPPYSIFPSIRYCAYISKSRKADISGSPKTLRNCTAFSLFGRL